MTISVSPSRPWVRGLTIAALALLAACGGDGNNGGGGSGGGGSGGGGAGGTGGGGSGGTGGAAALSFDRDIQKPIFNAYCVDCHYPNSATLYDFTKPFDMATGIVRRENSWVSQGSTQTLVVDPGNVANSFLIKKVTEPTLDDHVDGAPMPLQVPRLTAAEIAAVTKWITDGAKNDAAFTDTVAPIFGTAKVLGARAGHCTYCHYPNAPSGMDVLNVFDATTGMVNRPSRYGGKIVTPGDPASSQLLKKLTGATLGAQMPLQRDRLTPAQVETLRKWITAGAPNN